MNSSSRRFVELYSPEILSVLSKLSITLSLSRGGRDPGGSLHTKGHEDHVFRAFSISLSTLGYRNCGAVGPSVREGWLDCNLCVRNSIQGREGTRTYFQFPRYSSHPRWFDFGVVFVHDFRCSCSSRSCSVGAKVAGPDCARKMPRHSWRAAWG